MARWAHGDVVVRREVLGLGLSFPPEDRPAWLLRPWAAIPVYIVEQTTDELVSYIPPGAELGVAPGDWPTSDGRHPWAGRGRWEGHGALMVQRRDDAYAVWHFWTGEQREFAAWYVNFQAPYVETAAGYDTQDFELDLVVAPDRTWSLKDDELLDRRVEEGRFRAEHAAWIRDVAADVISHLSAGSMPWVETWRDWCPPPDWCATDLPPNWSSN